MAMFIKLSGDIPTVQKTFVRNAVSLVVAFFFVVYYRERFFGKRENQKYLLLRSTLGLIGVILNFYAIDHLVLSDADMLNKMSPFLTIIFAAVFLREYMLRFQLISVVIAFVGTLFIIKPAFDVNTFPYIIGVLSAAFAGGAYTVLRVLGNREQFYTVVFYFSFFSVVVLLPCFIFMYVPMTVLQWIYLLAAGLSATIGQVGVTLAYKYAPPREVSIFSYATVVFTSIFSVVLFNEAPDLFSVIGYIVIFGASYYMFAKNNEKFSDKKEASS